MTSNEADSMCTVLIKHAPKMREVGITKLTLTADVVRVELAPAEIAAPANPQQPNYSDPMLDPTTYAGGVVPGRRGEDDDE